MNDQRQEIPVDLDALCEWIESRPELTHIRSQAGEALALYRPGEERRCDRFQISKNRTLVSNKRGLFGGLKEIVWIPARKLRGNSCATPAMDGTAIQQRKC